MPRPRFEKLAPEKRERILEAAAREFAQYGFEGASMNRILEQAALSKGAAYYYFDDKADLFVTAVQHYTSPLMDELDAFMDDLDAESFWSRLAMLYRQQFADTYERPWVFALTKSTSRLSDDTISGSALAPYLGQMQSWLAALLRKGQELGVVRTDLPEDLLLALFAAVDDAGDQWLLTHWHELTLEEMEAVAQQVLDGMRRLMAPEGS